MAPTTNQLGDLAMWGALAAGTDLPTLEQLARRPAWMAQGACRDHPEVNFFPDRGEDGRPAKALCAGCPVREACAEAGLGERHGIWGGASDKERRLLRVARRQAA